MKKLLSLLRSKQEDISTAWRDAIYQTYPLDTTGFLRRVKDEFNNPVGYRTDHAVPALVAALLKDDLDSEDILGPVDDIIRVRAVQDFAPSKAVGVFFLLKSVVRKVVKAAGAESELAVELLQFYTKVDSVVLIAFDNYTSCREKLFQLRVEEIKRRQSRLLERAGMICSTQAEEPDPTHH